MLTKIAPLVIIPLLISVGQLLFKHASSTQGLIKTPYLLSLLTNPFLVLALVIYLLSSVWWVAVLRSMPLSRAYLFMALSFGYVPLMAHLIFGEPISWRVTFGILLVVAGIAVSGAPTSPGQSGTTQGSTIS
jgi:undecaprenyl phosphate-alpha-L-ara4N flippase subunit ArnE